MAIFAARNSTIKIVAVQSSSKQSSNVTSNAQMKHKKFNNIYNTQMKKIEDQKILMFGGSMFWEGNHAVGELNSFFQFGCTMCFGFHKGFLYD